MENLGVAGRRVFWCPRCGTLKEILTDNVEDVTMPKIMDKILKHGQPVIVEVDLSGGYQSFKMFIDGVRHV
jgi:hypothetical protein